MLTLGLTRIIRGVQRLSPSAKRPYSEQWRDRNQGNGSQTFRNLRRRSTVYYLSALGVLVVGASYAAVPMYRIFCQVPTLCVAWHEQ